MANFGTRVISALAGVIAGVAPKEVENLMVGDPKNIKEEARKVLGLEPSDVMILDNIKRMTPTTWSLSYLGIPRKVYEDYQRQLRKEADMDGEYDQIKLYAEASKAIENIPKIDGYINFYNHVAKICQPVFGHMNKWRFIPPVMHITAARDILNKALERESITLLDVFRTSMYMYYGVFNAVMGVKIDRKLAA
jgi:hypothetical protein